MELIYIGRASQTLRTALLEHLQGKNDCTKRASHYAWQLSLDPEKRECALLSEYEADRGKLPRCNAREG